MTTPIPPTLAEIEALQKLRLSDMPYDGMSMAEWSCAREVAFGPMVMMDDIAHLLRLVRERDARLAEIADICVLSLRLPNRATDELRAIHALATKEGA